MRKTMYAEPGDPSGRCGFRGASGLVGAGDRVRELPAGSGWSRGAGWAVLLGVFVLGALLGAPQILAQNPVGRLTGTVTGPDGGALPGVTVMVSSDALQQTRDTLTGVNGAYNLPGLPPGDYDVIFQLDRFATASQHVVISAAQTQVSNVEMRLSDVSETITITSRRERISQEIQAATTYTLEEVEQLSVLRTILSTIDLAPGVHGGPHSLPSINGAMKFENLFMINGVPNVSNASRWPLPLYIEDAVQETTATTSAVPAYYGRFTGGVVNVITKSGGNRLHGSLRVNFFNDAWISDQNRFALNPDAEGPVDKINHIDEATLGGYFWKDRLWFFAGARLFEWPWTSSTSFTNITFPGFDNETRLELKLTVGIAPGHSLIGTFLDLEHTRAGATIGSVMDLRSLDNREDPQGYWSVNYTGILSSSFFVEAQYSERDATFGVGRGGTSKDLIEGTLMTDRPSGRRFWSPTLCGDCPEKRIGNNENGIIKASYFLTSRNSGSHDLVFGYDTFSDIVFSVNHQSGSDFQVWAEETYIDSNNNIFPVFRGGRTWIVWWPPTGLDIAQPTDFNTDSFFVNDSWQLDDRWSFNIGVRYDKNDACDSSGQPVTRDSKTSPRLGAQYDVTGDGDLTVHASYGTYVAALNSSANIADGASTGGALAGFGSFYGGPPVNTDPGCVDRGDCVGTADALGILYDWYFANGGTTDVTDDLTNLPNLIFGCIPGATTVLGPEQYRSPSADEATLGVTKRLGNKGLFRADLVFREWDDFYSNRVTLETGTVDTTAGTLDVIEIGNYGNAVLSREYRGLNMQGRYRFTQRFVLAGSYTYSDLEGNIDGETGGGGPLSASPNFYPEYGQNSWRFPRGQLAADQKHKLRTWGIYDILQGRHNHLNVSVLFHYTSGTPYSALALIDTRPYVTNPGYASPPSSVEYFLSDRGAFLTGNVIRTDLAFNYAFRWNALGRSMEIYIQPEVVNVFNENAVEHPVTDISSFSNTQPGSCSGNPCAPFNPFSTQPVEGVHWAKASNFGQADNENDFQLPRIFAVAIGFRF